jgi:hypothetical protein
MEKQIQEQEHINYCTKHKLIIPAEVEGKIRYLCQEIYNVEWSGILFYTHTGSFEDNLVLECKDILLMDIGTQTYTEFSNSPIVISYMVENDLLDCHIGLIHSHQSMPTFFSGTDTATLKEEGASMDNFLSLIVNNKGNYTAAITRKSIITKQVNTVVHKFFGQESINNVENKSSECRIDWDYLTIKKESFFPAYSDIQQRMKEIKEDKASLAQIPSFKLPILNNDIQTKIDFKEKDEDIENLTNPEVTNILLLRLLTGNNLITKNTKIEKHSINGIASTYEERFGKGEENFKSFKLWAEYHIDFILETVEDPDLQQLGFSEYDISSFYAEDLIVKLSCIPENIYIKEFINIIKRIYAF